MKRVRCLETSLYPGRADLVHLVPFFQFTSIPAPSLLQIFSILLTVAQTGLDVPTAATQSACGDNKTAIPGTLFVKSDTVCTKENKDWWNSGITDMAPACIAMPSSPKDVSKIVKLLNNHSSVPFAIKSGGHDTNRGQSSVKEGVLIALRNIAGLELDKVKNVAYVKPGAYWEDIIKSLDDQGYTIVSGRLGICLIHLDIPDQLKSLGVVDIGGFLAQRGRSFLSTQHGMAADVGKIMNDNCTGY